MSAPDHDTAHWDSVYSSRAADQLGWFEETPATLPDVLAAAPDTEAAILDVGAGASTLVDHLLDAGYGDVTLLDLSTDGLEVTRQRLGERAADVTFLTADVRTFRATRSYDLWHDRAVFHFLTEPEDRAAYRRTLDASLAANGRAIIATFAPSGPDRCAGLPVARYGIDELEAELSDVLEPVDCRSIEPSGASGDRRPYTICHFVRR